MSTVNMFENAPETHSRTDFQFRFGQEMRRIRLEKRI